jgi:HD superfamily phosphodiesterase
VERVRRIAMKIAGTLGPGLDMLVVELAALFHDMAGVYTCGIGEYADGSRLGWSVTPTSRR